MPALLPYLRLLRVGTLFSPGADVLAGLCLCRVPFGWPALPALLAGVALYAGGMVLNDFADRRVDAVVRPERPLPRGQVRPATALQLGLLLLLAGCLLSPYWPYHLGMAALVLAYDFGAKRVALLGGLLMGLLRAANLGSGALLAAWTPELRAPLLAAAAAYAVYILAVTLLGIVEDAAAPPPRTVVALQWPPLLAALAALSTVQGGPWPAPLLALLPAFALLGWQRRVPQWDRRAIRQAMTWLLLGTMLYTALLCVAVLRWAEAAAIAACILPARWISRRIALT